MRYLIHKTTTILMFFSIAACSSSPKNSGKEQAPATARIDFVPGKIYDSLPCRSDPSVTYSIYFPSSYKPDNHLPLFLAFDPEAKGLLPVTSYRGLADKYGFILMGSNNSKNNQTMDETDRIVGNLRQQIATQLPSDPAQLFLVGFSGGSRIASLVCMFQQGIKGMIGCGAGFAAIQQAPKYSFDYFGIVGNGDFNLQEMIQLDEHLAETGFKHQLVIFKGKHEWPPAEIMELGIRWLLHDGNVPGLNDTMKKMAAAGKLFPASSFGKGIRDRELARQQEFQDAFFSKDISWWKRSVEKLRKTEGLSPEEAAMNQRLLSYLSLLCYSQSNRALQSQNREAAGYAITLYGLVDPDNPAVQEMKNKLAKLP